MKFQVVEAFEKHTAAAPIAPLYLIGSPDGYERRKIVEKLLSTLNQRLGDVQSHAFSTSKDSVENVLERLNTRSLFATVFVGWLDEIEKLKADEIKALKNYFSNPSAFSCLILSGSSLKQMEEVAGVVVLDLNQEKPWEKKERLKRWLLNEVAKEKKKLSADALEYVTEHALEFALLEQELSKWLCTVGSRDEITLKDIQAISSFSKDKTFWQIAEGLIWGDERVSGDSVQDPALLFPLIGQLRGQLELGLKLSTLVQRGTSQEEIKKWAPQLRPATFQKCLEVARKRPSTVFKKGLTLLFELELALKSGAGSPALLFDLFVARWMP